MSKKYFYLGWHPSQSPADAPMGAWQMFILTVFAYCAATFLKVRFWLHDRFKKDER